MFKKTVVLSVAVALVLGLMVFIDPSSAAQETRITSVSKKGSLLVWPKIETFSSPVANLNTIVTIANDGASPTWVKCYWMDKTQAAWDFEFQLTANQPAWFEARTGEGTVDVSQFGDNKTGELKCFAVDINPPAPATTEVLRVFNQLYGSAVIIESAPNVFAFEYQAWAFAANGPAAVPNGPINLNGTEYDYCPSYLVYNFFAQGADGAGASTLSLSPCQQDLRQDKTPICTKAKFDIWNEDEIKFTGAYQCVKCYFEGVLTNIGTDVWIGCNLTQITNGKCKAMGVGGNKFLYSVLHTPMGRFRVNPLAVTDSFAACKNVFAKLDVDGKTPVDVCSSGNQYRTPFVGVLLTEGNGTAAGTTGTAAGAFVSTTNLTNGVQLNLPPQIKWDAADTVGAAKR